MRKAMVLCVLLGRFRLEGGGFVVGGLFVRLIAMLGFGRVRVETGCLLDRHWSLDGGQLRDAMEGLRQKPRVERLSSTR